MDPFLLLLAVSHVHCVDKAAVTACAGGASRVCHQLLLPELGKVDDS
jgi:hypothetical protein